MGERAGRAGVRVRRRVGIRLTHTPLGLSRGWVWWPGHGQRGADGPSVKRFAPSYSVLERGLVGLTQNSARSARRQDGERFFVFFRTKVYRPADLYATSLLHRFT